MLCINKMSHESEGVKLARSSLIQQTLTKILVDSIQLITEPDSIYVVPGSPITIEDYDNDGTSDLMVKFSRNEVQNILSFGDYIEVIIKGRLDDGRPFQGKDIIRVIDNELENSVFNGGKSNLQSFYCSELVSADMVILQLIVLVGSAIIYGDFRKNVK